MPARPRDSAYNHAMRTTLAVAVLFVSPCLAQNSTTSEPPARAEPPSQAEAPSAAGQERPINYSISARGDLGFNAGLSDSPGNVTVSRGELRLGVEIPAGQRGSLGLGFQYEVSDYAFHDATGIIPGTDDPWGTVHRESVALRYARQSSQQWSWIVGSTLNWAAEDGGKIGDSFTASVFGVVRCAVDENLSVGLGLQFASRLEDSDLLLPFPSLNWKIAEQWRLTTERTQARGVGLGLIYTPDEQWSFELAGGYEPREFRLDRNGPLPNGVVRDTSIPVSLSATYAPSPHMTLTLEAGAYFGQSFKVLNSSGSEVSNPDVDPTPFVSLQFGYRF
jgi:hypothetical protein